MNDIFISYSSSDRLRAQQFAQALQTRGWTVWWDRNIPAGRSFDEVIEEALIESRCVLVLWSNASVRSDWVKEEALEGARRKILVPVFIDQVNIPLGFRRIQTANLTAWQGSPTDPIFERLLMDISVLVGQPSFTPKHDFPKHKISTRETVKRNVLLGLWTGTYIQEEGYYPFTLIVESEDVASFKGRIVEPLPDWILDHHPPEKLERAHLRSTVSGRINKNTGDLEFIKKYNEPGLGLDYEIIYVGVLRDQFITGEYYVDEIPGPFELVQENT